MFPRKTFSEEQLANLSGEQIIDMMQHEHYSLLDSLGAKKMRKKMVPAGVICNRLVNYPLKATAAAKVKGERAHIKAARQKLVKLLAWVAPGNYDGVPKDQKQGLVVGFNHPSLGEIGRIMMMKIDIMGDRPMYFPVNLPWYEALAPNYDNIRRLGIIITPTITPSTWKKLNLKEGTAAYKYGERLKDEFRHIYTDLSHRAMREGGVIFVAPSATRQRTVFRNKAQFDKKEPINHTMSLLAIKLYADPKMDCDFLPLGVLPPEGFSKTFNVFKPYRLIPGKIMKADEIRKKYFKTKNPEKLDGFDWEFHKRIADVLPKDFWY